MDSITQNSGKHCLKVQVVNDLIYLERMLFERRNSVGNQLSPFNMREFATFVLLRVFTLIETICPKFWAKPQAAQE